MATTTVLGFPRIGARRELKRAQEAYWNGRIDAPELERVAAEIRKKNYCAMLKAGIDELPVGDFSLYDHVLDAICMFGAIPQNYTNHLASAHELYFAMARGCQKNGIDLPAMEMTKWFDTNYHHIVPQLATGQGFSLDSARLHSMLAEAKAIAADRAGLRPVVLGPVSFLLLSKTDSQIANSNGVGDETPLNFLEALLPVYEQLLGELSAYRCVQIEEPFLALDLSTVAKAAYRKAYSRLGARAKLFVTSYFAPLQENAQLILEQPLHTLHIDLTQHGEAELEAILASLPPNVNLSAGVVDGRNIWRNRLRSSLARLQKMQARIGTERLMVSSSCSLLHSPVDLSLEKDHLDARLYEQLAFASQKLDEICILGRGVAEGEAAVEAELQESERIAGLRSLLVDNASVQQRLAAVSASDTERNSPFAVRQKCQQEKLQLPLFPTTTIGSFPQTLELRKQRSAFRKGKLSAEQYQNYLEEQTLRCIQIQEELGLDVLVHGEFERTDMVEYFGEQLEGLAFTRGGWVQSYGSRCVRPPIIYGDVSRPEPMTTGWMRFAQKQAGQVSRPMKAMLTGPITILKWSFVRDDQPLSQTCRQIALALRDEVLDLEKAGLPMIQIDEPAIREALPLRKAEQPAYLRWAVECFRLSSCGVKDETQIHTHMCYSEFNEIMGAIAAMDADVISIEASRSQLDILKVMGEYPNGIGLGVYDIHSPRIPKPEEMAEVLRRALGYLKNWQIWVNPDCGLKTRDWPETKEALRLMVEAAKTLRKEQAEV